MRGTPGTAREVRVALRKLADPRRAGILTRFFQCQPGGYGEGDRFLGLTVPAVRLVTRRFRDLPLSETDTLLTSPMHEERLTALLILVQQFTRATDEATRRRIFRLYVSRLAFVNNWDLVDTSAEHIVGGWLENRPRDLLDRLARSPRVWSRRVAMIATFHFIKQGDARDAVRIATLLLRDDHDLIHKAVGWMLREAGKRAGVDVLRAFLTRHAATMPRTTLRYAIERLPEVERRRWMAASRR